MPAHWRTWRIHTPYSSAVRWASVARRQWPTRRTPSNTPRTVLVFPTSMVRSITTTRTPGGGESQAPSNAPAARLSPPAPGGRLRKRAAARQRSGSAPPAPGGRLRKRAAARQRSGSGSDPRPHLLHVPGEDTLQPVLGPEEQGSVHVDVLRPPPQLPALGLDQHLFAERRGQRAPASPDRLEPLLLVEIEPLLQGPEEPGEERG